MICQWREDPKAEANNWGFSHDVTKIQTSKLLILPIDENGIAHAHYFIARSCDATDAMYPVRESRSKLEFVNRLLIDFFACLISFSALD